MPTPKEWKDGSGGGTPITATALIDLEERLQRGVSAKDYGAKGDGETDDSAALKEALEAAEAASQPLYLPPGTYSMVFAAGDPTDFVGNKPVGVTVAARERFTYLR